MPHARFPYEDRPRVCKTCGKTKGTSDFPLNGKVYGSARYRYADCIQCREKTMWERRGIPEPSPTAPPDLEGNRMGISDSLKWKVAKKRGIPYSPEPPREVPYGTCHCGCGQKTNISKETDKRRGAIRGEPRKFVAGHQGRTFTDRSSPDYSLQAILDVIDRRQQEKEWEYRDDIEQSVLVGS